MSDERGWSQRSTAEPDTECQCGYGDAQIERLAAEVERLRAKWIEAVRMVHHYGHGNVAFHACSTGRCKEVRAALAE
jgi:hypothetical protein